MADRNNLDNNPLFQLGQAVREKTDVDSALSTVPAVIWPADVWALSYPFGMLSVLLCKLRAPLSLPIESAFCPDATIQGPYTSRPAQASNPYAGVRQSTTFPPTAFLNDEPDVKTKYVLASQQYETITKDDDTHTDVICQWAPCPSWAPVSGALTVQPHCSWSEAGSKLKEQSFSNFQGSLKPEVRNRLDAFAFPGRTITTRRTEDLLDEQYRNSGPVGLHFSENVHISYAKPDLAYAFEMPSSSASPSDRRGVPSDGSSPGTSNLRGSLASLSTNDGQSEPSHRFPVLSHTEHLPSSTHRGTSAPTDDEPVGTADQSVAQQSRPSSVSSYFQSAANTGRSYLASAWSTGQYLFSSAVSGLRSLQPPAPGIEVPEDTGTGAGSVDVAGIGDDTPSLTGFSGAIGGRSLPGSFPSTD